MNSDGRFYVTTPIYYVNFKPHIGTSYTTILTDAMCRYRRLRGLDTLLVTGSDEHSQNIADLATQAGKTPLVYCDEMVPKFHKLWDDIDIERYSFIRTSSPEHHALVQRFWQRSYDKGDVYKDTYSGWYHTSDNRFLDADEVPEHPEENPRLKFLEEDAYFFRLSKYEEWLKEFHNANPHFVLPDFRRNEMLNRIEAGLKDICISRTSTDWGIPLPWDSGHVFYVWIEALLVYLTGSGFDIAAFEQTFGADGRSREVRDALWETTRADLATQPAGNYWPCDLHLMAKDIPWFHAVIWPAMLASYGAPPPKQMLVHGYWQFEGEKMSKSLGNVVDPYDAEKLVGVDGLRYFLLREAPAGLDGNFSHTALVNRFNYDLANDFGNLVHRTVSMLHQMFEGKVPEVLALSDLDEQIEAKRQAAIPAVLEHYEHHRFSEGLQEIWALIGDANKYIDEKKPWELKKKSERFDEISTVFNRLLQVIRTVLVLASPVIPAGVAQFWHILGLPGLVEELQLSVLDTPIPAGHAVSLSAPVYQRVDSAALLKDEPAPAPAPAKPAKGQAPALEPKPAATVENADGAGLITIDDFTKVLLKTAEIRQAARVEGADKLLKLSVFDGERERTVLAGIALHYTPEEITGQVVILVANLQPRKLRGELSEGMLLAATNSEGRLSLLTTQRPVGPGCRVS
jgi:methionyl-tRNA synthetase